MKFTPGSLAEHIEKFPKSEGAEAFRTTAEMWVGMLNELQWRFQEFQDAGCFNLENCTLIIQEEAADYGFEVDPCGTILTGIKP